MLIKIKGNIMNKFILFFMFTTFSITAFSSATVSSVILDDYPNTPEEAQNVLLNTEIQGNIELTNDTDWFKFTVDTLDGFEFVWKTGLGTVNNNNIIYVNVFTEEEALSNSILTISLISETVFYFDTPSVSNFLNLEPGVYYIRIRHPSELTGYEFQVKSDYNDGTWSPDTQTINYCKEHLSECGIKPTVVVIPL